MRIAASRYIADYRLPDDNLTGAHTTKSSRILSAGKPSTGLAGAMNGLKKTPSRAPMGYGLGTLGNSSRYEQSGEIGGLLLFSDNHRTPQVTAHPVFSAPVRYAEPGQPNHRASRTGSRCLAICQIAIEWRTAWIGLLDDDTRHVALAARPGAHPIALLGPRRREAVQRRAGQSPDQRRVEISNDIQLAPDICTGTGRYARQLPLGGCHPGSIVVVVGVLNLLRPTSISSKKKSETAGRDGADIRLRWIRCSRKPSDSRLTKHCGQPGRLSSPWMRRRPVWEWDLRTNENIWSEEL
jgi:hypothetical protein